jgi:hypothetical protein
MDRPPDPPPGYHWEAAEEGPDWRLVNGKNCRQPHCPRPSAAELARTTYLSSGKTVRWWAYCDQHLYGRWIEDGKIMHWILKQDG